jgi:hypothetical protein
MTCVKVFAAVVLFGLVLVAAPTASERIGPAWWYARDRPCRWSPTLAEARRSMRVFEGIVVDEWREVIVDVWSIRVLRHYRFQVLRDWSRYPGREAELVHGWSEGERYMSGTYPEFRYGHRYLVASATYDAPAHTFTTSCFPGAADEAIPALAARLGPPAVTYEPVLLPRPPLAQRIQRDVSNAERFGMMAGYRALDVIGLAGH